MLLSLMYISFYTTIYFFIKNFIFSNVLHFSEYDMRMSLYFFLVEKGPSINYVCNWWEDAGIIYLPYRESCHHTSCIRTQLHNTFPRFWQHFCLIVSSFICRNSTLPLFKKDEFMNNSCFSPARSISVVMK